MAQLLKTAYESGHRGGLNGLPKYANPHHYGSPKWVMWRRGWFGGRSLFAARNFIGIAQDNPPTRRHLRGL